MHHHEEKPTGTKAVAESDRKKLAKGLIGAVAVLTALGAGCASQTPVAVQSDTPAAREPERSMPEESMPAESMPESAPTPADVPEPVSQDAPAAMPSKSAYKDGTYTADGEYMTHVGPETITMTLTLKDGIIVDSVFASNPNFPMSRRFQEMFVSGYKEFVIGKSVDEVHLTKVSGSSLTPIGFNEALEKIKVQAQA